MPRAKRAKVVHLTKTKKKDRDHKEGLLEKVKRYLGHYERVYSFEFENLTTAPFKELFNELQDTKFCLGKKTVLKLAFGKSTEEEPYKNSHLFAQSIKGQIGLIFTNKPHKEIVDWFKGVKIPQFASPGQVAVANVELLPGPEALKGIPTSNDTYLRKLGLSFDVLDARLVLNKPYIAAMKGKTLSIEQSRVLKFLGVKLGTLVLRPTAAYDRKTGKYTTQL